MKKYDFSVTCGQLENMDIRLIMITIMNKNPILSNLAYMIGYNVHKLNRMMEKLWERCKTIL